MKRIGWLFLLGLLALSLTACQNSGVQLDRNGNGGFVVTVSIAEEEVNEIIGQIMAQNENPLLMNPVVSLQAGEIVVSGTRERSNGETVNGRITLVPSVEEGVLLLQATSLEVNGESIAAERLAQFNERLATRLMQWSSPENRLLTATAVSVTDENLNLTLEAKR